MLRLLGQYRSRLSGRGDWMVSVLSPRTGRGRISPQCVAGCRVRTSPSASRRARRRGWRSPAARARPAPRPDRGCGPSAGLGPAGRPARGRGPAGRERRGRRPITADTLTCRITSGGCMPGLTQVGLQIAHRGGSCLRPGRRVVRVLRTTAAGSLRLLPAFRPIVLHPVRDRLLCLG